MGLPDNKKEALKQKVSDTVHRTLTEAYKDLRSHEVDTKDSREVVESGAQRGYEKYLQEKKD